MAFSHTLAVGMLESTTQYKQEFTRFFGTTDITIEEVTAAISEFEITLLTPNSPFYHWLLGDDDAISDKALAGYSLFKSSGCVGFHNGPALGGNSFQKIGVVEPNSSDNPSEDRAAVTGEDADRFSFKVPTLRNVELTYPYFHDGAADKLAETVDSMGRIQLGKNIPPIGELIGWRGTISRPRTISCRE